MRPSRGFTLIELMITIAIIAILAAIALPSYSDYVRRGRLTETLSVLSNQRVKMEQYFQDNRTYAGACQANTVALPPVDTVNFTYTCVPSAVGVIPSTYLVTSTGIGTMLGFQYTIDQSNVRTTVGVPTGWAGAGSACWVTKKDGSC